MDSLPVGWDPFTLDANPALPGCRVGDFELDQSVTVRRLSERRALQESLEGVGVFTQAGLRENDPQAARNRHYRRAYDLLLSAVGRSAFDLTQETPRMRSKSTWPKCVTGTPFN